LVAILAFSYCGGTLLESESGPHTVEICDWRLNRVL
jgi:hypothetical protein